MNESFGITTQKRVQRDREMDRDIIIENQTTTGTHYVQFLETNQHPHSQAFTQLLCNKHHV